MAMQNTPEDLAQQQALREFVKNLRTGQLLSQRDLSARMDMAQGNFARLENGSNDLKLVTIQAWARALGYSVEIKFNPLDEGDPFDIALLEVFG